MASLHVIKTSLSPFSVSKSYIGSEFNSNTSGKKKFCFRSRKFSSRISISGRLKVSCKVQDGENQSNGEEPPESLFMKELKRRGMTPTSLLEESNKSSYLDGETKYREDDGGFSRRNAVSTNSGVNLTNQREQSMALNSEGLEGLIPRAKLLLTLGGTFFLGFLPLIMITVAFFSTLYLGIKLSEREGPKPTISNDVIFMASPYFGQDFVRDASKTPITPPQYVDPYELLEEKRISQTAPRLN